MYHIRNCQILTSRGKTRIVNLGISRGKIVSISRQSTGYHNEISDYDAKGNLVFPSFIDCHCHLFSLAEQVDEVKLRGCESIYEMQGRIKKYFRTQRAWRKSGWIYGRGWDQELFAEKRLPSKKDLDAVTVTVPIVMTRICGHIAVMNSKALDFFVDKGDLLEFDEKLVSKDYEGNLTGIVKETALANCWAAIPKPSLRDLQLLFLKAQSQALYYGLSGVHCILDDTHQLEAIRKLDAEGRIRLKLSLFLPIDALQEIEQLKTKQRTRLLIGKKFRVIGLKLFADGSLGARTAALDEDYSDESGNNGILNYCDSQIVDFSRRVKRLGLVLASHAIGDRAVEQVANAYKKAGVKPNDHFRIEHCSVVRLSRISNLSGIVISIQPMFATSDLWLKKRIGYHRSKRVGYAFRSLEKTCMLLGGSDAPVEPINPITGIAAATKSMADRNESLSIMQAIQIYTRNAARSSPLTRKCGLISLGNACDVVILDANSLKSLSKSRIVDLFVDGKRMPREAGAFAC